MKKLLLALTLLLVPGFAWAQCNGVFPNNTVCGNTSGASNLPRSVSPSTFLGAAGGTNGQIQYNTAGALGGFTLSGDGTVNTSTGALTLSTVNGNVGSFGSATTCITTTVNAKGLITAISAATCTPALGSITGFGTGVATLLGSGATGTGAPVGGTTPTIATPNITGLATYPGSTSGTASISANAIAGTPTVHWPENSGELTAAISPQFEGGKCDGSTDNTTAINNAIAALPATGGIIRFPPDGICIAASVITINKPNVHFVGDGTGGTNASGNIASPSQLRYSGTAARFIDARDAFGFNIKGMAITWSNAAFAGNLIDLGTTISNVSAYTRITDSFFGTSFGPTGLATCIAITDSVDALIQNSYFYHCAPAILGETTISKNTTTRIVKNTFAFNEGAQAISSCGEGWVVEGNSFEATVTGTAGAFSNTVGLPCFGMQWSGNWFGDVTTNSTAPWITFFGHGFSFTGNQMSSLSTTSNIGITLNAATGFSIMGNTFQTLATGINYLNAPDGGIICGNTYRTVTNLIVGTPGANVTSTSCNVVY